MSISLCKVLSNPWLGHHDLFVDYNSEIVVEDRSGWKLDLARTRK
jgi:hypothetical protein